jgi:hypothetical protein
MAPDKPEMVSKEESGEQVRRVCRRLGLLHFAFSSAAVTALGKEKGEQLILDAIKNYARIIGEEVKKKVVARGLANIPANYQEDLPLYGMHKGTEKLVVDGESRTRMYGCAMAQVWHELGADELGRLYCCVDIAKYMAFNPDFKQVHISTVTDGCEHCEFAIRPTTEQERKDLATPNQDWRLWIRPKSSRSR